MRRRDIASALVASVGLSAVAGKAEAQTCSPPCYPLLTPHEQAQDIVSYEYPPGDVRRYFTSFTTARAAIQKAINVMVAAGGGVVYIPKGEYTIDPVPGQHKIGLVVPYSGSPFLHEKRIILRGEGRNTVLKAGGSEMVVLRWSDSHGRIDDIAIDGTGHTQVTGLALIGSGTANEHIDWNCISNVAIDDCTDGIILMCPPGGGCYYNRFEHCSLYNNTRHVWLHDSTTQGGANRNVFIAMTMNGGNTGFWIDGADTTRLVGCSFEDIAVGSSPSVQPTAVHITQFGTLGGLNSTDTNLIGCVFEGCVRDLNCDQRRMSVIGGNCGVVGAVTGAAKPDMLLGGDRQYQLRELHLGGETDGLMLQPNQTEFGSYAQVGASSHRAPGYPFNADGHLLLQSRKGLDNDVVFVTGSPLQARVRITGQGKILPVTDAVVDLGASGARWREIFAVNGVISTSDEREKVVHGALNTRELNAARRIARLPTMFQWKESVSEKGEAARLHCGVLAQSVRQAFTAEGLDPDRYAMNCIDEVVDAEGNRSTRYSLRYAELATFVMAAQEQRLAALEAAM